MEAAGLHAHGYDRRTALRLQISLSPEQMQSKRASKQAKPMRVGPSRAPLHAPLYLSSTVLLDSHDAHGIVCILERHGQREWLSASGKPIRAH